MSAVIAVIRCHTLSYALIGGVDVGPMGTLGVVEFASVKAFDTTQRLSRPPGAYGTVWTCGDDMGMTVRTTMLHHRLRHRHATTV